MYSVQDIPRFELHELDLVLAQIRCNTAADANGLVVELFMYSTVELQIALVNTCHTMLRIGSLAPRWPNTLATLFPGTGGTNDAYPVEVMGSMVEVLQRPHTSTWAGCWWAT